MTLLLHGRRTIGQHQHQMLKCSLIEIKCLGKQEFEISQPFLIDCILALPQLEHNRFKTNPNDKLTPATPQILNKDLMGKPWKKSWKYQTAVGMLSYLPRPRSCTARYLHARPSNGTFLEQSKIESRASYSNKQLLVLEVIYLD